MSLIKNELNEVWSALRSSNKYRDEVLTEVRIKKLRGIGDIRIPFNYPVTVLAGPNASGKSTVLLACACAYQALGQNPRALRPSSLFPNFTTKRENVASDRVQQSEIEYWYLHKGNLLSMTWKRRKTWTKKFRMGNQQPERQVYLHTLANLTNPSEVRSVLKLGREHFDAEALGPKFLLFAERVLPWRYRSLTLISGSASDLLFAEIEDAGETRYSEFHMSSGERSILHISKNIAQLSDALVLIDEIDTGLHPHTQQEAMLALQRMALRQNLQFIIASHSPVVLDSVPEEARIFLDIEEATGQVRLDPLRPDIFQKALYGQSRDQLSVLCEDEVAEGVIRGVLDVVNPELGLRHEDIVVGRNQNIRKDEFPANVRTLAKFRKLDGFVFILNGKARDTESELKAIAENRGQAFHVIFLPGEGSPEQWLWKALSEQSEVCAARLGLAANDLDGLMRDAERFIEGNVRQEEFFETVFISLSHRLSRNPEEVARIVARVETENRNIPRFVSQLKDRIALWRQL